MREDGAIRRALPSRQSRWSRGRELERSRWSRGDGNVVVEDGSSLSISIIMPILTPWPKSQYHLYHPDHNDDDLRYLRQRGVDDGEPGVGVPAGLPPPTSICSWAPSFYDAFYHEQWAWRVFLSLRGHDMCDMMKILRMIMTLVTVTIMRKVMSTTSICSSSSCAFLSATAANCCRAVGCCWW